TSTKFWYWKAFESSLSLHDFLAAHARSVRAILASLSVVDVSLLELLPEVRVIATTSAGLNLLLDLPKCYRRGIKIANAGDVYSVDVANCAIEVLIDVPRKISASNRYVK
ncbi:unnamed protein product, partial [Linum tenue]